MRKFAKKVIGLVVGLALGVAAPAFAAAQPNLIPAITVHTESTGGTAALTDVFDRLEHDWFSYMFGGNDFRDAVRFFTMAPTGTITFDRDAVIRYGVGENPLAAERIVRAGETLRISDFPRLAVDTRGLTNAAQWPTAPRYTFFELVVESDNSFSDHFIAPGEHGSYHLQSYLDWIYRDSDEEWRREGQRIHWNLGFVWDLEAPATSAPGDHLNLSSASAWAHDSINQAFELSLIPAALQNNYTANATRAEFAAFAVALYEAATGREIAGRVEFNDTDDINVQKMGYLEVVTGVGGGNFAPNDGLTREQAAVMIARLAYAIGQPLPQAAPTFADNAAISPWAVDAVGQMQTTGIMGGVGDNNFAPGGDYTREQSIITMLRLFEIVN